MARLAATYIFMRPIPSATIFLKETRFFSLRDWESQSWAPVGRGVPVRIRIRIPTSPKAWHVEVRLVNGTGSPYLVLVSDHERI